MPIWMPGRTACCHCGGVLHRGADVLVLPPAWLPGYEPMHNFRGHVPSGLLGRLASPGAIRRARQRNGLGIPH